MKIAPFLELCNEQQCGKCSVTKTKKKSFSKEPTGLVYPGTIKGS